MSQTSAVYNPSDDKVRAMRRAAKLIDICETGALIAKDDEQARCKGATPA